MVSPKSNQWFNWRGYWGPAAAGHTKQVCVTQGHVPLKHLLILQQPLTPSSGGTREEWSLKMRSSLGSPNFRSRSSYANKAVAQRSELATTKRPNPDWSSFLLTPSPKVAPWHRRPPPLPRRAHPCPPPEPSYPILPTPSAGRASARRAFDDVPHLSYKKKCSQSTTVDLSCVL